MRFQFSDEELQSINEQHVSQGPQSPHNRPDGEDDSSYLETIQDDESGAQDDTEKSTDVSRRKKCWEDGQYL